MTVFLLLTTSYNISKINTRFILRLSHRRKIMLVSVLVNSNYSNPKMLCYPRPTSSIIKVILERTPFKIFSIIIFWIFVFVVYTRKIIRIRNKSHSDKTMHQYLFPT